MFYHRCKTSSEFDLKKQPMKWASQAKLVMPGLVPGIHVLTPVDDTDVDGRDEPGHDGK